MQYIQRFITLNSQVCCYENEKYKSEPANRSWKFNPVLTYCNCKMMLCFLQWEFSLQIKIWTISSSHTTLLSSNNWLYL